MSRFIDLNEQDRIQYVKDGFVLILEQLAKDPSKLSNYIKLEAPKLTVAALETIKESTSKIEMGMAIISQKLDNLSTHEDRITILEKDDDRTQKTGGER